MENANAELEAGAWVKSQVETYTDMNAYLDVIPEGTDFPAVRYEVYTREGVRTVEQHIVWDRIVMRVYVTVQGERITPLVERASDLHAALHRARGETPAAQIIACTRLETYGNTEKVGGDIFRHAGGLYEILVMDLP
jgi:hypothetical protein